ncbi:MAG: hypothetical protein J6W52_12635 [Bacteroidaceae bacterium]|nr:hypothetical protein [Bacteroidaceae bacterium]
MKKTYITPQAQVELALVETMIVASITTVGGDANIEIGEGEVPDEADVKGYNFGENIFE